MQTKLDAYNYILSQVGAAPVSTLNNMLPDLTSAVLRLDEANLWVQKTGWWFNQILCQDLVPDETTGIISLAPNTLKIKSDYPNFILAQYYDETESRVYDPLANSYSFDQTLTEVEITLLLDWEFLPMSAKDAVMYRAAATMVQHELEDMNKSNVLMQEFQQAYVLLKAEDLEIKQRHSYSTPAVRRMMNRVKPYKRRSGTVNPYWPGGQQIQ